MNTLTPTQQKILFEIYKKNECSIHDFVPGLFKYHTCFYRVMASMPPNLVVMKKRELKNVYHLTIDGEILMFALKTALEWS